jgi:hypothetical protein
VAITTYVEMLISPLIAAGQEVKLPYPTRTLQVLRIFFLRKCLRSPRIIRTAETVENPHP